MKKLIKLLISASAMLGVMIYPTLGYSQDAHLDTTFGLSGKVILNIGEEDKCNSIAMQPDGKIILFGTTRKPENKNYLFIARYKVDGNLDSAFGSNGILLIDSSLGLYGALLPDGKIIGIANLFLKNQKGLTFFRFNSDGSTDTTFGTGKGRVTSTNYFGGEVFCVQPDGRILFVMDRIDKQSNNIQYSLLRFKADGNIDSAFGVNGLVETYFGNDRSYNWGKGVTVQGDGKMIVLSKFTQSNGGSSTENFSLTRFNENGKIDSSFGWNGSSMTEFKGNYNNPISLAIQSDGKIVVVGFGEADGDARSQNYLTLRFNKDGRLDDNFGILGVVKTNLNDNIGSANNLAIDVDDKILVIGNATGYSDGNLSSDFATIRYNNDGNIDSTFGHHGSILTNIKDGDGTSVIAIQSDGKIVVAGNSSYHFDIGMVRYLPICQPMIYNWNVNICEGDSFLFQNKALKSTGIYRDTVVDAYRCDSVTVLNLKVNKSTSSTIYPTGHCRYYVGDSAFTQNGTYHVKKVNDAGCDSNITLILTMNPGYPNAKFGYEVHDREVKFYGPEGQQIKTWHWNFGDRSEDTTGSKPIHTYLQCDWFDVTLIVYNPCGKDTIVQQINSCQDTTVVIGVSSFQAVNGIKIYPNPTHGIFDLDLGNADEWYAVNLYNYTGQLIESKNAVSSHFQMDIASSTGLYLLELISKDGRKTVFKICKE